MKCKGFSLTLGVVFSIFIILPSVISPRTAAGATVAEMDNRD
jgi:hypothetical protein